MWLNKLAFWICLIGAVASVGDTVTFFIQILLAAIQVPFIINGEKSGEETKQD